MAISRAVKEARVAALQADFQKARMSVLTDYKGLSVTEIQALRAALKAQSGTYRVVKNSLLKLAAQAEFKNLDLSHLDGPVALAFGYDDEVAPAKAVAEFAKTHEALQIIGAINSRGDLLDGEAAQRLSQLPSREQLNAQLVGTIAAPLSGLVTVLAGNLRWLVTALSAVAEQQAENS